MEQKNIIVDYGWYSHHLLIKFHRGLTYHDNKLVEEDIIDEIIKEWFVDNTTRHSMYSLDELKSFRGYIAASKEAYYLLRENLKDKIIIALTKDNDWWDLLIKDKKLYPTKIEYSNNIESIFKGLYSKYKYKQWIKLNLSENDSVTKKMKSVAEYIKQDNT
jgi:hypothetical protein